MDECIDWGITGDGRHDTFDLLLIGTYMCCGREVIEQLIIGEVFEYAAQMMLDIVGSYATGAEVKVERVKVKSASKLRRFTYSYTD